MQIWKGGIYDSVDLYGIQLLAIYLSNCKRIYKLNK